MTEETKQAKDKEEEKASTPETNRGETESSTPVSSNQRDYMTLSSARSTIPSDFKSRTDSASFARVERSTLPIDVQNLIQNLPSSERIELIKRLKHDHWDLNKIIPAQNQIFDSNYMKEGSEVNYSTGINRSDHSNKKWLGWAIAATIIIAAIIIGWIYN